MRKSFSMWECYAQCPRKFKYQYIEKLPRSPAGPAAERGNIIHAGIEQYIKGTGPSHSAAHHGDIIDRFRDRANGDLYTEYKVWFDEHWNRTIDNNKDAAWVVVLDAALVRVGEVEIGEWKTGKPKDSHRDQRTLYAIAGHRIWGYPKVSVTTYYLDGTDTPKKLTVSDSGVKKIIKIWDQRADIMESDNFHPPRAGYYCRWCDYRKSAGGPCPLAY